MKRLIRLSLLLTLTMAFATLSSFGNPSKEKHYLKVRNVEELHELFRYRGQPASFLSAHRGGPQKHMPENCLATFSHTLNHTAAILEVDPRYTKDGRIILHHDETLQRTTTGQGLVRDHTYRELKKLRLKDMEGRETRYRIPTLRKALKWAKGKTILVLDKKDVPIEERLKMVEACKAEAQAIIMAYTFEEAKRCYQLNNRVMMQVFINSEDKIKEFEETGVPWENVVVFVSHQIPDDPGIFQRINEKGPLCILGTSRHLDRDLLRGTYPEDVLKTKYNDLYRLGVDILETDLPVEISRFF